MGLRGRSMRRDVKTSPSFGLPSLFSQLPLSQLAKMRTMAPISGSATV